MRKGGESSSDSGERYAFSSDEEPVGCGSAAEGEKTADGTPGRVTVVRLCAEHLMRAYLSGPAV